MVDVRAIKNIPPTDWATTKVGALLADSAAYCVLDPETEAADALHTLVARNCNIAPVVRHGELIGMLTRSDLFKLVALKREIAA
jgi:hypothetical protein